jgi:hypothetical protein
MTSHCRLAKQLEIIAMTAFVAGMASLSSTHFAERSRGEAGDLAPLLRERKPL